MTPAASAAEFARHAWDFRDAAVGAEHLLGERLEYQSHASLPVACLFGVSIELALRAYILATNPAWRSAASTQNSHDLRALYDAAIESGAAAQNRWFRTEVAQLAWGTALDADHAVCGTTARRNFPFNTIKDLCEKLLEIACATAGYERMAYE
jgi:hypothetical protein